MLHPRCPHEAFDLEWNVPLALAGNPWVHLQEDWCLDFKRYLLAVATYKTPHPEANPKRYQAFVLTPAEHMSVTYPVASLDSVSVNRSEDERYFTSMQSMIACCLESERRDVLISEIAAEFDGRTAQEMIDYFKPFDVEPRNCFPAFPSDVRAEIIPMYPIYPIDTE